MGGVPVALRVGAVAVAASLIIAPSRAATSITATSQEARALLGDRGGRLVYVDVNEDSKCYWIDLGDMSVHELSPDTGVSEPLLSPDGSRVVYGIYNIVSKWPGESQDNTGDAYIRALAGGNRSQVAGAAVVGHQAFAPHWWVDPATGAEHITYMDYYEKDTQSAGGRGTWKQLIVDEQPVGDPIRLLNHAFDGGLSRDGTRAGEAYHYLHMALTMDLGGGDGDAITPRLDGGNQCCNASMSPGDDYQLMHLRIDHEGCNIRDWGDNLVATIWKPAAATEMQNPEFSTHPGYSTFTAQFGADYYIYIADTQTGESLKIAEGNFAVPHLWVAPDTPALTLQPSELRFDVEEGGVAPADQVVAVGNAGASDLDPVSVSEDAAWLSVSVAGAGDSQTLNNAVDPTGLGANTYTAAVEVDCANADNAPRSYDVTLVVAPRSPDVEAPSVAITLPADGATISGLIAVEGVASDDRAIAAVALQIDDGAFADASGAETWTATVDAAALTDGPHTITARATDAAGNSASDSVAVVVDSSITQPGITLLEPTGGERWEAGSTQHIRWSTDGIDDVTLRYSADGGASFEVIEVTVDQGSAAWGDYSWQVPDAPTTAAVIFIMGYFGEAPTRSASFEIRRAAPVEPTSSQQVGAEGGCACRASTALDPRVIALALVATLAIARRRRPSA